MTDGPSLERRLVTVLFADLVGFTSLAEQLDAEDVAGVQDGYFAQVREVIERYGGRLEKFIGDAAMAVFGVPRVRDDDTERAVRAGLALVRAVEGLAVRIGLDEGTLRLRVGVNTGEVAYTPTEDGSWRVSGDAVNVAARLQASAEPGTVLLGDTTALAVAEVIALGPPQELALKGKAEPVRAWTAVTPLPQRSRERAMGGLRAPLLGRRAEVERLQAALVAARAGSSRVLLVVAPPGVGKTRLVDDFAQFVAAGGVQVRKARIAADAASPAAAVLQLAMGEPTDDGTDAPTSMVRDHPALSPELAAELARLTAQSPAGQPLPPGTQAQPLAAATLTEERTARFRLWLDLLDALGGGQTAVWLIEDVHWASRDLVALLEHAAEHSAAAGGRLILATARPSVTELLTSPAAEGGPLQLLHLAQLAPEDTVALVRALVGDTLPGELVTAIAQRSDGNPLFVEELLRTWVSIGVLVRDGEVWQLTAQPAEPSLPHTVHQIYAAQLDDLPDDARALARRGSVAGRIVPRLSLPALEAPSSAEAIGTVDRRALLADTTPDPIVGPALSYRHVLLRDAGYASLSRAERARLHVRLAEWYEEAAGDRVTEVAEQIAAHYAAALDNASRLSRAITSEVDTVTARRRATDWYERAADHALGQAAHASARKFLSAALAHAGELSDGGAMLRARLLLRSGEVTAYTDDMDAGHAQLAEAVALYSAAFEAARSEGNAVVASEARAGYAQAAAAQGRVLIQQIEFDRAGRIADEALSAIGEPDDAAVARLLGVRGWVSSTLQPDRKKLADLDRALAIARAAGDRHLELDILQWRAMALGEVGDLEPADWQAVESLALDLGDWSRAVKAMRAGGGFLVDDEADRIWELANRMEAICRRRGLDEDLAWVDYLRSEAGLVSGEWDRVLAAGLRAIELSERNAYHRAAVRTWHVLLPIAGARGDRELVEHAHSWLEPRRESLPDSPYARVMIWAFERQFIEAGLRPRSVPELTRLLPSFEGGHGSPSWLSALEDVVAMWLAAGDFGSAREAVARVAEGVAGATDNSLLGRAASVLLGATVASLDDGSAAGIESSARDALAVFRRIGATWWTAKALHLLAATGASSDAEAVELAELARRLRLRDGWAELPRLSAA